MESKKTINNIPAFPCDFQHTGYSMQNGMTLRDYFANSICAAMHTNQKMWENMIEDNRHTGLNMYEYVAQESYTMADAMLEYRELTKK